MVKKPWSLVARRVGGILVPAGSLSEVKLALPEGEIRMHLVVDDSKNRRYTTRVAASYANVDDFRFSCGSDTPLQKVLTFFGADDVEVGHGGFDRSFAVRTNDPDQARALFEDEQLRRLLAEAHEDAWTSISSGPSEPDGASPIFGCRYEVVWSRAGAHGDVELLTGVFAILARVLVRLAEIGSAKRDGTPGRHSTESDSDRIGPER